VLAALVLAGCGDGGGDTKTGELSVFVSIDPLRFFVETIGGDRVGVFTLVAPGQSPATYEPTAKQLAALAGSDLFFLVGVPAETTVVPRLRSGFENVFVCDVLEGIDLIEGHAGHGSHEGPDPHVWLSPRHAVGIAENVTRCLIRRRPAHADEYRKRLEELRGNLMQLDEELTQKLAPFRGMDMVVFHPAFGYFAEAYGLNQVAIEQDGIAPGSRRLAQLIDSAREKGVRTVFVQPQFSSSVARNVAGEIGAELVALDPLSADYIANMRRIADAVHSACLGQK
jgi:zinc transport system substrate-binding protein